MSGKRGVGKTTAALYLRNNYGVFVRSFASPLRRIGSEIFPFSDTDFKVVNKEQPYKYYDWTPRDFIIGLGQFICYYDKNYLINELIASIESPSQHYVIDDVRLPEEVEALKKLGAKIVRINRYKANNPYKAVSTEITETALDNYTFDYIIEDCVNITLNDLKQECDTLMNFNGIKRANA